jgi:hypothetical protein
MACFTVIVSVVGSSRACGKPTQYYERSQTRSRGQGCQGQVELANEDLHNRTKVKSSSYGKYLSSFCCYLHLALFIWRSHSLSSSHLTDRQSSWWTHTWADVRNADRNALAGLSEWIPPGAIVWERGLTSSGLPFFSAQFWGEAL